MTMLKPNYRPRGLARVTAPIQLLTIVVLSAIAADPNGRAQDLPKASNAPTSNSSTQHVPDNSPGPDSRDDAATTLKVNVDLVQLFFNVKDKHGALVPNLPKENFDIFEDGKQQTIKYFKAETDLPLTLGILIDSSGSQMRVLDMEKEVGASFLENIIRTKDEAFVISFDIDITLLQDFTNSVSRLRHALNEAKINTGGVGCSSGPIGPARSDSMRLERAARHGTL